MSAARPARASILLATLVLLPACAAERSGDGDGSMVQDTFIKPIEREPLTAADLAGMDLAQVAVELPWTRNRMTRDPVEGAPPADVRSADVEGHESFDRVTFQLDDALPMPGYEVTLADSGAAVACGSATRTLDARSLVATFRPARGGNGDERWIRAGVGATGASRMGRAGVLCDEAGTVTWIAEITGGDQVRVLELRGPSRIAVDVR